MQLGEVIEGCRATWMGGLDEGVGQTSLNSSGAEDRYFALHVRRYVFVLGKVHLLDGIGSPYTGTID